MSQVPKTLADALAAAFESVARTSDGVEPPAAILWPDLDGQWRALLPILTRVVPSVFILGEYRPAERTGPAIWLKCIVDRMIAVKGLEGGAAPILYLPRVSRQELRSGGDCPVPLHPLIELQYRGTVWHQRNGREWTVEAFLTSEQGLGLDLAADLRTREAMLRSLPVLATIPVAQLKGRRLEAEDFDRLSIGDPIRDLLEWMDDPDGFRAKCDSSRWETFLSVCHRDFAFDPEQEGVETAADSLLNTGGIWDSAWRRFSDAPRLYPKIPGLMRQVKPLTLLYDRSRLPQENEEQERRLREELTSAQSLPHEDACNRIVALEAVHRQRRGWVWAQLGESPLAMALEPLGRLADCALRPSGGATAADLVADHVGGGWRCDEAALKALAAAMPPAEMTVVSGLVKSLYLPLVEKTARRLQELALQDPGGLRNLMQGGGVEADTCVLFADGLRFDLGASLKEVLEARGLKASLRHLLAPLPTVTASDKPLASPVHKNCSGSAGGGDFTPLLTTSGQPATTARLRSEMARQGVELVDVENLSLATNTAQGGWAEVGRLDEMGHSLGIALARQVPLELESIAGAASRLLDSGWRRVQIVTDHGWMLVPGGLPKITLPASVVATRWARCALVQGESQVEVPVFPWHWNNDVRIAVPPGAGSFIAGAEYAHGGMSLQECVIPELVVERGTTAASAKIAAIVWKGLRCRVTVETNAAGAVVELRRNWRQPDPAGTRIAAPKSPNDEGVASLAVERDELEGTAAMVVVVDGTGRVLTHQPTTIGESR
jgi:hypothetical protein